MAKYIYWFTYLCIYLQLIVQETLVPSQHLRHVQQSSILLYMSLRCQNLYGFGTEKKKKNRQENESLSPEARTAICTNVAASQKKEDSHCTRP